jgi:hypothetical protein
MRHSWLLALAALLALPARGSGQQYTINPSAGITAENFRNYETGMRSAFGSRWVDGVMVEGHGFGQAFTVAAGSTLLSYTLFHDACRLYVGTASDITGSCLFRSYVAGFDAASGRVTNVLWESPAYDPDFRSRPWPFTPGVWLDAGKYVAFVLYEGTPPEPGYTGGVLSEYSELYPIGSQPPASPGTEQVRLVSRDPRLPVGETVWTVGQTDDVQNFSATLDTTVTPEPATVALLGTGLAGLAGAARRKRRRQAAAE